jgi:tetratricopeptide (TPR) repeat protein
MAKKFSTNNPPGDKIKKRRFIEVSVAFLLVVLGLALYLTFSNRWEKTVPEPQLYMIQELEEAVNNYRLENFERAEMLLNGVLENAKNRPAKSKAALYLGNIYYKRTQYAKAALYYQDALFYQKNNTYAAYNRALTLLELGDLQRAERYARDVYKRRPDFQPNITLLGNIYYAEGKYREAVSLYAKGDGGDELSLFNQAQAHLQLGQVEQASGLFQRIINNKSSELVIRGLSLAALSNLAQKGRVEATIDYLEMASDIFPSSLPLRYNLSLLFFKRRRFSDAATQLKQIVTGSDSEDLRFLYGSAMFHSAKYREALQYYESVYEKRSDSTTASIIGDFYLRLGDPKGAAIFYEKALENPENETALINLVRIYMQEGDYLKAAELCNDFVDRSDANPTPDLCLAEVFYGTEKDREAGESLENALAKLLQQCSEALSQDVVNRFVLFRSVYWNCRSILQERA